MYIIYVYCTQKHTLEKGEFLHCSFNSNTAQSNELQISDPSYSTLSFSLKNIYLFCCWKFWLKMWWLPCPITKKEDYGWSKLLSTANMINNYSVHLKSHFVGLKPYELNRKQHRDTRQRVRFKWCGGNRHEGLGRDEETYSLSCQDRN